METNPPRYDRTGCIIRGKSHRVTFIDRVTNNPIHVITIVERYEYNRP